MLKDMEIYNLDLIQVGFLKLNFFDGISILARNLYNFLYATRSSPNFLAYLDLGKSNAQNDSFGGRKFHLSTFSMTYDMADRLTLFLQDLLLWFWSLIAQLFSP